MESNWLFDEEFHRYRTPSRMEEVSADSEITLKRRGCHFIKKLAELLNSKCKTKISSIIIDTAMILLHRFFMKFSHKKYLYQEVGAACLVVACKDADILKSVTLIAECTLTLQLNVKAPKTYIPATKHVEAVVKLIIATEGVLLAMLNFEISIHMPHIYVLRHMQRMHVKDELIQAAFVAISDIICVSEWITRYPAKLIATICIAAICKWANFQVPEFYFPEEDAEVDAAENVPWYAYLVPRLTKQMLQEYIKQFELLVQKHPEHLRLPRYALKGIIALESRRKTGSTPQAARA